MALDWCQNSVFVQYFENEWVEFNQICIHIIIDKIYVVIVKDNFLLSCITVTEYIFVLW